LHPNPVAQKRPRKNNRRKALPNGFGQISEIKGRNLRKPFRAMVTVGKNSSGRPIARPLKPESYFSTYNDAYAALVEYNRNPYDLSPSITLKQLYEKWSKVYFESLKSDSSSRTVSSAWAYCSSVYNMRVSDIRARHIKGCMDEGTVTVKGIEKHPTSGIKVRIKSIFNLLLDYALEYELVYKNYARTFNISNDIIQEKEEARRGHMPFTNEEMDALWKYKDNTKEYVDVVLIQCYSGWRPQELGLIRLDKVDLSAWTFAGGMKTEAGKNRTVPIHSRIRPLVERRYKEAVELGSDFLINGIDSSIHRGTLTFSYEKYKSRFTKLRDSLRLNPQHRPHDGRMHFITMAKKYGVDEYAIKYIVGHSISDITEKIYTQREFDWLKTEMEKIETAM
jgi:integrase